MLAVPTYRATVRTLHPHPPFQLCFVCEQINIATAKFLSSSFIASDLLLAHSNATLTSLHFPSEIQSFFTSTYDLQLHVSYIFFILSLCWTSLTVFYGLLTFLEGQLG